MEKRRKERIEKRKALKKWSLIVRARDKNKCQICGSTKNLNAHHIIPKENHDLMFEPMNGICLCVKCHKFGLASAHKNGFYFISWLAKNRPIQYNILFEYIFGEQNEQE
jgi:5-methylcytosine-specific restriction endonuclease McrA